MSTDVAYTAEVLEWRKYQEELLRAEDGWLTLVGLFWLAEGVQSFGSDPTADIVLPPGVPSQIGTLTLEGERVFLRSTAGVDVQVNGVQAAPEEVLELQSDGAGKPDLVTIGSLVLFVIRRGVRIGIRARDRQHPARTTFAGRQWFPVDSRFHIAASFESYDQPRPVPIPNVLGDVNEEQSPGEVCFSWEGQEYRLVVLARAGGGFFLIFRDRTSGTDTYPAARFLMTDAPVDGQVVLDFNRAVSPPCAFSEFATCPLPPRQNQLSIAITAGERWSPGDGHGVS